MTGCEHCGGFADCKWKVSGRWLCVACLPKEITLPTCATCGAPTTRFGIERFAIGNADRDSYSVEQCLCAGCDKQHVTLVAWQWGPGAKNAGEPIIRKETN